MRSMLQGYDWAVQTELVQSMSGVEAKTTRKFGGFDRGLPIARRAGTLLSSWILRLEVSWRHADFRRHADLMLGRRISLRGAIPGKDTCSEAKNARA